MQILLQWIYFVKLQLDLHTLPMASVSKFKLWNPHERHVFFLIFTITLEQKINATHSTFYGIQLNATLAWITCFCLYKLRCRFNMWQWVFRVKYVKNFEILGGHTGGRWSCRKMLWKNMHVAQHVSDVWAIGLGYNDFPVPVGRQFLLRGAPGNQMWNIQIWNNNLSYHILGNNSWIIEFESKLNPKTGS